MKICLELFKNVKVNYNIKRCKFCKRKEFARFSQKLGNSTYLTDGVEN